MEKSKIEIIQDQLRNSGHGDTLKLVEELLDARAQEYRIQNDHTIGDETRIVQGKIQGLEDFKNCLNLKQL